MFNLSRSKIPAVILFVLFACLDASSLFAHPGHEDGTGGSWIHWIGEFHPVFLHFPIVLVVMTCIAEFIDWKSSSSALDHACRFMIFSGALFAVLTVLCGLALAQSDEYSGIYATIFWWHQLCGFLTAFLIIAATFARETYGRHALYGSLLFLALIGVFVTGFFGGSLTFGIGALVPPDFS
jgi:uncharacterized membrane protein